LLERPAELAEAHADVWIFGNPPVARANRNVLPRLRGTGTAAAWLFRSLRQRSKMYERVVEALLEARPQLAVAAGTIDPVPLRRIADQLGIHESTLARVCSACRVQNLHGVWSLSATRRGIAIT
jgi:DNA-directed RNA polymerase specialized sigma54-like protein